MKTLLIIIFWFGFGFEIYAHGRSEAMIRELNAPVPDWMSLAKPVKVEPVDDGHLRDSHSFRPRSGGATNSRNRVHVPDRGISFQVDYPIDWTGNNDEGLGVSLSPNGTKLIVNSGLTSHLYRITPSGDNREMPIRLPHVTYDDGVKGYITKWAWASNDVLVGKAGIMDELGHEIIEGRLYVFHLEEQALARLDLSALNVSDTAGIEIIGIGEDLEHLRIGLEDQEFFVKADLKSPPKLLAKPVLEAPTTRDGLDDPPEIKPDAGVEINPGEAAKEARSGDLISKERASEWLFVLGALAILGLAVILIRFFLRGRVS